RHLAPHPLPSFPTRRSSDLRQCILDGALTKRMQAGQAASAGVFSAVLAQTGFTGARNIFNGRFGFFELYQPSGYDAVVLLRDLGDRKSTRLNSSHVSISYAV